MKMSPKLSASSHRSEHLPAFPAHPLFLHPYNLNNPHQFASPVFSPCLQQPLGNLTLWLPRAFSLHTLENLTTPTVSEEKDERQDRQKEDTRAMTEVKLQSNI